MARKLRVIGLGGSMASGSRSQAALRIALDGAKETGANTLLLDIRELDLPMYVPGGKPPQRATELADHVHRGDAMIWSSPLYHGTISGAFKNALDWLQLLSDRDPPYLHDMVVGLISAAGGSQGLQAVNTMEFVVRALRGWAVPFVVPVAQADKVFDEEGRVTDPKVERQLKLLGAEVGRVAEMFAGDKLQMEPEVACAQAAERVAAA